MPKKMLSVINSGGVEFKVEISENSFKIHGFDSFRYGEKIVNRMDGRLATVVGVAPIDCENKNSKYVLWVNYDEDEENHVCSYEHPEIFFEKIEKSE